MGVNSIVFVAVICASFASVFSLQCYFCETTIAGIDATLAEDCRRGNVGNMTKQDCEHQINSFRGVDDTLRRFNSQYNSSAEYTCVSYGFKPKNTQDNAPSTQIRGCLRNTGDVCKTLQDFHQLAGSEFNSCELCTTDLCNSASAIGPVALTLAVLMSLYALI